MKTIIHSSILLALASSGIALGAATATTTPVGYVTTTLKPGYNNIGVTVLTTTKMAGDLDVISTGSVQDTSANVNFTTALGATGVLHVLEITNGPAVGLVTEITTWTTDTITTVDNLVTAGVLTGNTYRIRKCPTLEDIFTTNITTGPLTSGTASTADIVYVPTATPGQYTLYFLSGAGAFRKVSPAGLAPNVPLVYLDGLFVQRRATGTADLVVTGEVKTEKTGGGLLTGFNYLGIIYPVGSTLQNSGLENYVTPGTATTADIIYIPSTVTNGQYTLVFRSAAGAWRTVSPAGVAPTIDFIGSIFIERKGGATPYAITPPSTWQLAP